MELSGEDIVEQLGPLGGLDRLGMTGVWRALQRLENKMYRGTDKRWRAIPDPNLMVAHTN